MFQLLNRDKGFVFRHENNNVGFWKHLWKNVSNWFLIRIFDTNLGLRGNNINTTNNKILKDGSNKGILIQWFYEESTSLFPSFSFWVPEVFFHCFQQFASLHFSKDSDKLCEESQFSEEKSMFLCSGKFKGVLFTPCIYHQNPNKTTQIRNSKQT